VYLHPCGDLLLFRDGDDCPLSDRLLVGVYDSIKGTDIKGDIETAMVDLEEEWGVAA
jgi:hypothetical protein